MTANAMASDRAACLAAGMNDHVGKPFHLAQLTQLILKPTPLATTPQAESVAPATFNKPARPAAPVPMSALPPVDAVDSQGALDRLGGNQALYSRVLRAFLVELTNLPAQFDTQLKAANLVTAERMLHTLKGLSATVGATYLAAVARQAQLRVWQSLDKNQPLDAISLSGELRTALANTQTVIERVAAAYEQTRPDQAATPLRHTDPAHRLGGTDTALLREWIDLLKASDMRAQAVFEQLRDKALTPDAAEWQQMRQAMDVFDFKRAASLGNTLLEKEQSPVST